MKNTIAERIADFLKQYPPFDLLSEHQLLQIAREVQVIYLEKGRVVFQQDETGHSAFYVVHKGAIALMRRENGEEMNVDKCDEGDIFGLRPLFAKENYQTYAVAEEESILYAISIDVFRPLVEKNRNIGNFLIESFASNTDNPFSNEHKARLYTEEEKILNASDSLFELQPSRYVKDVVTASPETPIKTVAGLMSDASVGSVVITVDDIPLGIVTDKDFRTKVATGTFKIDQPVSKIMSSPVICYPKGITIAQAQITMMKHKVSHICITKDGTPNTKLIGIVSEHDIVVMQGSNPAVLMKAIKRSNSTKELKKIHQKIMILLRGYIQQNIPLSHTSRIIFEFNDATIKRVVERCLEKMGSPPPVSFAWMSLGSQGRKEQLLHTDQDNAIIFEDVPEAQLEEIKEYFLALAKKVNKRLNIIGYEYCSADMMAKNPKWCLSLEEWKNQFSRWTTEPGDDEILLCSIFFDYDISYGDASLTNELADHIFEITRNNQLFLSVLGASALRNPSPLGFFRQFLVEQDGEHKDFFDLKKRALMPITDAGRLLILSHQVKNINNTAERFEKLAELEPENSELYLACSYAVKALLKFRTKHGLQNHDNGRYIALEALTKEEKMKLKRCFKTITEVQQLIKLRFNVAHFI